MNQDYPNHHYLCLAAACLCFPDCMLRIHNLCNLQVHLLSDQYLYTQIDGEPAAGAMSEP